MDLFLFGSLSGMLIWNVIGVVREGTANNRGDFDDAAGKGSSIR